MPGRIRDEDVATVRDRTAIVDVIGEYVPLRSAGGGSMKGLCPFHDEKTPSFNVNPSRGFWHCFGCAAGGDVIKFVMDIDSLSFPEAVERLADRAHIQLRYENAGSAPVRPAGQRSRLVAANAAAQEFYAEQLLSADAVAGRTYLSERGFDADVAQTYGCGYAPRTWDALTKHLRGKGFTDK